MGKIIWVKIVNSCNTLNHLSVVIQDAIESFLRNNLNLHFRMEANSWSHCLDSSFWLIAPFKTDADHSCRDSSNYWFIFCLFDHKFSTSKVNVDETIKWWWKQKVGRDLYPRIRRMFFDDVLPNKILKRIMDFHPWSEFVTVQRIWINYFSFLNNRLFLI